MEMECDECGGTGMIECPLEYGEKHPENCPSYGGERDLSSMQRNRKAEYGT